MKKLLIVALVASGLVAVPKSRDWKTGTLEETVRTSTAVPRSHTFALGASPRAAADALASQPQTVVVQGYRITGNGYSFLVSCDIRRGKVPNVTVHGAIKYALVDGTFYLLDEDGREFKATVLEKALLPPPAIPPGYEVESAPLAK